MSGAGDSVIPAAGAARDSWKPYSTRSAVVLTVVLVCGIACNGSHRAGDFSEPQIRLSSPGDGTGPSTVDLVGLPSDDLSAVRAAAFSSDQWTALLRVSVAGKAHGEGSRPAVVGTYSVADDVIRFRPLYAFDPGRDYRVVFDPSRLPRRPNVAAISWRTRSLEATVREPAPDLQPTSRVVRVYPTADELPENQLRLYIRFSAPMGLKGGGDYVRLLDADGRVVEGAFLPLDVALWNADRTRYTLLFDPGRVKRGILPNERMGRPITQGGTYTFVIDRAWRDASGLPLVESFSRQFRVGPPEERAIDPARWRIAAPPAGTRDPLVVSFQRPLDYALLHRAIMVATAGDELVSGDVDVEAAETQWVFRPHEPWGDREYRLRTLSTLEDPSGNRVGRPFEVGSSPEATSRRGRGDATSVSFRPTPSAH